MPGDHLVEQGVPEGQGRLGIGRGGDVAARPLGLQGEAKGGPIGHDLRKPSSHISLLVCRAAYQRVMTTFESVKNCTASRPWPCMVPKKESFWPANGK